MKIFVALPSGRILDVILPLLNDAGYQVSFGRDRRSNHCIVRVGLAELNFCVIRSKDAASFLKEKTLAAAFIGADILEEQGATADCDISLDTGLSPVRFCLAAPAESEAYIQKCLVDGKEISVATKFPNTVRKWANQNGIANLNIIEVDGSVEPYPKMGFANAIADIVETGTTLAANGLVIIETIRTSSTLFAVQKSLLLDLDSSDTKSDEAIIKSTLLDLRYAIECVLRARSHVQVELNVKNPKKRDAVLEVILSEALESVDTIEATDKACVFSFACAKTRFHEVLRLARIAGASGELVSDIKWLGSKATS